MNVHHDIPYAPPPLHPLRCFDLYLPSSSTLDGKDPISPAQSRPSDSDYVVGELHTVICFIHGGAWRAEDKSLHHSLALSLLSSSHLPVLVPNYRLSPAITHPTHALDVLDFLEFIIAKYQCKNVYLVGHSCAAHMLSTIFLDAPELPTVSSAVLAATKAVVLSEGIYDIPLLLRSFPDYLDWFIADAFPTSPYPSVNTLQPRSGATHMRWLILHSEADTLVDQVQSEAMVQHLSKHFPSVQHDFHTLTVEHDELLSTPEYIQLVSSFLLSKS